MKDIPLLVGKRARNFSNVKKLLTNTTGSGTQLWIPEDEAAEYCTFETLRAESNGTFTPQNSDGYDKVIVDVHDGGGGFIEKVVEQNGVYKPADDGVPGYSSVVANVPIIRVIGEYTINLKSNSSGTVTAYPCGIAVVGDDVFKAGNGYIYKQTNGTGAFTSVAGVSSTCRIFCWRGELYQFSWYGGNRYTYLSKWNGSNFSRIDESAFPSIQSPLYNFETNAVVVYHDAIYVLGGRVSITPKPEIYRWSGTVWEQVGEIPSAQQMSSSRAPHNPIVYNDKIYYFYTDSGGVNNFYSWDGSVFTKEPDLPNYRISGNNPAVFKINGKERIHLCAFPETLHYSFNGEFWRPETAVYVYTGYTGGIAAWVYKDKMYASGYDLEVIT